MTLFLLAISLCVFPLGTYVVWPSRWNIPAHLQLGFCLVAYVIPLFLTDIIQQFPKGLVEFFVEVMLLGAICYLSGMVVGTQLPRLKATKLRFSFEPSDRRFFRPFVSRRAVALLGTAVVGLYLSYLIMGYIPMFAANPWEAKYARGDYREAYHRASILFQLSYRTICTLFPIIVALWWESRRIRYGLLATLAMVGAVMTLQRGEIGSSILIALGLVAATKGRLTFLLFLSMAIIVYVGGTLANFALPLIFGERFGSAPDNVTIWNLVALGAPDISDGLRFLHAFMRHGEFTYGLTFLSGLIPFNYAWTPGFWAWTVVSGSHNLEQMAGGGLRLPAPIWGYSAFGLPGVIGVCFISGGVAGYGVRFARRYVGKGSLTKSAIILELYYTVIQAGVAFYTPTPYSYPSIFVMVLLAYGVQLRLTSPSVAEFVR